MSWWREWLGLAERDDTEPVSMPGFPLAGGVLPYGVNETSVAGLPTVLRCLDVIATAVGQLPWAEFRGTLDLPPSRLVARPSAEYTRREWVQRVTNTLALERVCYLLKVGGTDAEGVPTGLWPLAPQLVSPVTSDLMRFVPAAEYWIGQRVRPATDLVILRLGPLPGVEDWQSGTIRLARAMLGGALAAENYASRYWQGGGSPTTVLETEGNLSDGQADMLRNRYAQNRSRGPDNPIVLSHGTKAREFGADPTTASATEARAQQKADLATLFGIPPRLVNAPSASPDTYKTAQEENLDLLHYTLENYIGAIEDAISSQLPGGRYMAMKTTQLTEGTQLSRAQSYQLATGNRAWISVPEVREAEGLPPEEMPEPQPQPAPAPLPMGGPG